MKIISHIRRFFTPQDIKEIILGFRETSLAYEALDFKQPLEALLQFCRLNNKWYHYFYTGADKPELRPAFVGNIEKSFSWAGRIEFDKILLLLQYYGAGRLVRNTVKDEEVQKENIYFETLAGFINTNMSGLDKTEFQGQRFFFKGEEKTLKELAEIEALKTLDLGLPKLKLAIDSLLAKYRYL